VDRKDGGHKRASPGAASHLPENKKEQQDRAGMEKDTRKMVAAGIEAEELKIQHVRERGKRMPVSRVGLSEGQADAIERKARGHDRTFINVILIVISDELVPKGLAKDQPDKTR
jgi:hypothetical protein